MGWLKAQKLVSHSPGDWKFEIRVPVWPDLVRALLLV